MAEAAKATDCGWVRVASRRVRAAAVSAENFAYVMGRWRDAPQHVFQGFLRCDVCDVCDGKQQQQQQYHRRIAVTPFVAPRALVEASEAAAEAAAEWHIFEDTVTLLQSNPAAETAALVRAVYTPRIDASQTPLRRSLPKPYPKALRFAFVYELQTQKKKQQQQDATTTTTVEEKEEEATIAMDVVPLPDERGEEFLRKLGFIGEKLLRKAEAWSKVGRNYKKQAHHDQLVPREVYAATHRRLKQRYAGWTEKWAGRKLTSKYVHEDIAIAAYFICLAEQERAEAAATAMEEEKGAIKKEQQTFADLGCGNGFLVHVLTEEGYRGFGVDLNEREPWRLYDRSRVDLRAEPFDPTRAAFPGTRWFIGNHADELTPWVPVIAARSGAATRFINIACCFHGFDGRFAQATSKGAGKYLTYLRWLANDVSPACGFVAEWDWLRMPSTKNVALVGRRRTFATPDEEARVLAAIDTMLAECKPFKLRDTSKAHRGRHVVSAAAAASDDDESHSSSGEAEAPPPDAPQQQ